LIGRCRRPEQHDAGEDDAGSVVAGVFVVACGDASPALESVERSLDDVPVTVELGVEMWRSAAATPLGRSVHDLVALLGNDHTNSPAS